MENNINPRLAAVQYDPRDSADLDALLTGIATHFRQSGFQLSGAVQHNKSRPDRCRCDMVLEDLSSGALVEISQDRGKDAKGCRLDHGELERLAGLSLAGVQSGADLVIINRFGKLEANGRGFRSIIAEAACRRTPCLVGVGRGNMPAWHAFAPGFGTVLSMNERSILAWCYDVLPAHGHVPLKVA